MNKNDFNILLFSYSEGMGLTHHATQFALSLKRFTSNFIVVNSGGEQSPGLIQKLKEANIEIINIQNDNLSEFISKKTVIHCRGFRQASLVKNIAKQKEAKILITMHAYRNGKIYKNLFILYTLLRFKFIDKWIFHTYNSYLDYRRMGMRKKFSIIKPGLESVENVKKESHYTEIFTQKEKEYKSTQKYIFYTAQFRRDKRHKELLKNIAPLLKKNIDFSLVLAGSGKFLNYCEKYAQKLGIRNQVIFLGRVNRNIFLNHLKNASVSLVFSKSETCGYNILEPMLLNIPVISTPVGIAPEIIKDYENGAIFELKDKEKMLDAIDYFCSSDYNSKQNKINNKDYSWDIVAQRYYQGYCELMK